MMNCMYVPMLQLLHPYHFYHAFPLMSAMLITVAQDPTPMLRNILAKGLDRITIMSDLGCARPLRVLSSPGSAPLAHLVGQPHQDLTNVLLASPDSVVGFAKENLLGLEPLHHRLDRFQSLMHLCKVFSKM